jgi:bisphosphoglycerate-independent phosphoglycerate mutase (AlkP superfamily)/very-short-patch-repair endonuclease
MKTKILCILDGFGIGPDSTNNAITRAKMPNLRRVLSEYFWTTLDADGEAVGQEAGLVGNSEVGHMNLGGLQLVPQLSYQITKSAENGFTGMQKDQLIDPNEFLKSSSKNRTVHLIGLFSTGTIHSDLRHWAGAIQTAGNSGMERIVLHLFSDGRDSDKKSLVATWQYFITEFKDRLKPFEDRIFLGSLGGRFYAMDRDQNMDRTISHIAPWFGVNFLKTQNHNLVENSKLSPLQHFINNNYGQEALDKTNRLFQDLSDQTKQNLNYSGNELQDKNIQELVNSLQNSAGIQGLGNIKNLLASYSKILYATEVFDENMIPITTNFINPNETLWLINFRSDRMKQLAKLLCEVNQEFDLNIDILAMNDYGIDEKFQYIPIFKTQKVQNTLAQTITRRGQTQLHIAETEKYAHVTYFLNGGSQEKNQGEHWELIPSNKVDSHAEKPEMKAKEITDYILDQGLGKYNYIIANYANPDMVAHTGLIPESVQSIEFLDHQLGRLIDEVKLNGHSLIITADHGNCEFVGEFARKSFSFDTEANKQIELVQNLTDTEHNPNPVPCIVVDERFRVENKTINTEVVAGDSPFPKRGGSVADGVSTLNFTPYPQLPQNNDLKEKAKELRQSGNLSEVILWNQIKSKKLLNLDFTRQKIVGNYIVDFYCAELALVIEIDGESHDFKGQYDVDRDLYLKNLGLNVVRFEDIEVRKNLETVIESLYKVCEIRVNFKVDTPSATLPPLLGKGESPSTTLLGDINNLNLAINQGQLSKALTQKNYKLITKNNWLTQNQINELKVDQLPLWYAGVILLGL